MIKETTANGTENINNDTEINNNSSKAPVKKHEPLEVVLRRFKKQSSGVISEIKKREAYDKPSVKRKKKSKEARKHKKNNKYNSSKW